MCPLIAALLRPKRSSIRTYLEYSKMCVQRPMWLLLVILTSSLSNWKRKKGTPEAEFLPPPIAPIIDIILFKFFLTADCFWRNPNFYPKKRHGLTWHPPHPSRRTQICHITIGDRWCEQIGNSRSFWLTDMDRSYFSVFAFVYT